jgi:four helix bundle protein
MKTPHQYSFEKLRVWQAARQLAKQVYLLTSKFSKREIYGLTGQCNRAAISIAANLAEGSSRQSRKDQAHFSEIAYGSLMELACLLVLCRDGAIVTDESERDVRASIDQLSSQLNALHRSQWSRID